jgi:hypothetical protein
MEYRTRLPEEDKVAPRAYGKSRFSSHATLFGVTHDFVYVEDDCVRIQVKEAMVHSR